MDAASIIKSQLTCADFLQGVGVSVNRSGFCRCPFHGVRGSERTASMKVYSDPRRGYHCFGCHAGGDVINLAMQWYDLPFRDAIKRTAEDFGIDLPDERKSSKAQRELAALRADMARLGRDIDALTRQSREDAFWAAFDAWMDNDRTIRLNAPDSPLEPYSDAWCEAVRHKEEIMDELQMRNERRLENYARR